MFYPDDGGKELAINGCALRLPKGVSGVVTLSTDHVLANNLRIVNYVYRGRQLLPNSRVPGFASHRKLEQMPFLAGSSALSSGHQ